MSTFVIILHVIVSIFMILVVLLQPGGKGGMGSAFGGAGGQTVFGGRGANTFLAKLTAAGAVVFMLTSFSLVYFSSRSSSVMDGVESKKTGDTVGKDDATKDGAGKDGADKAPGDKATGDKAAADKAAKKAAADKAAADKAAADKAAGDKTGDAANAADGTKADGAKAKADLEKPRPLPQGLSAEQLKEHTAEMDAKNKANADAKKAAEGTK